MFLPSLQLENESFVLKDISIVFKNHFMLDSSVLIHHIHSAVPLLFMLFESCLCCLCCLKVRLFQYL